jgi:hypothetical protein
MSFRGRLKYDGRSLQPMTRYSASRGIRYSAPPGPDGRRTDANEAESNDTDADADETAHDELAADTAVDTAADATADD